MNNTKYLTIIAFIISSMTFSTIFADTDEDNQQLYADDAPELEPQDIYPPGCIPTIGLPISPEYIPCEAYFPLESDLNYYYDIHEIEQSTSNIIDTGDSTTATTYVPQASSSSSATYYYPVSSFYPYYPYYPYAIGAFTLGVAYGTLLHPYYYNNYKYYWRGYSWNDYKAGTWNTYHGHGVYWHGENYTGYCRNGVCQHWDSGQHKNKLDSHVAQPKINTLQAPKYNSQIQKHRTQTQIDNSYSGVRHQEMKRKDVRPHTLDAHPRQGEAIHHRGGVRR